MIVIFPPFKKDRGTMFQVPLFPSEMSPFEKFGKVLLFLSLDPFKVTDQEIDTPTYPSTDAEVDQK
jgi:hypothetical protein